MSTPPSLQHSGHHGMHPWTVKPDYKTYKSPHGPKYEAAPNFNGINPLRAYRFGKTAAGFGAVAGVFALFFFAEVPKVRHDIMEKMPIIGSYFTVEVPPEDNPF